jgi:hypothetical protein
MGCFLGNKQGTPCTVCLSTFQFNQLGPLQLPSLGVFDCSALSAVDAVQELVSDDKVSILHPLVFHVPFCP